jgi:catechol 2,3-dioxygenase-like lactoylglutathione lyase family enzyme
MDYKLELVVLPVADVDRAKDFYLEKAGFRLDTDFSAGDFRVVQLTPPGSACSITLMRNDDAPGSVQGLHLVVADIVAARDELAGRGATVSEFFHYDGDGQQPGLDPSRANYGSFFAFGDPDGNGWLVQEIKERLPGRVTMDVDALAALLHETAERHGAFEAVAPAHDWWDWYAAYLAARQAGEEPDEAAQSANRYMADVKQVVVPG